MNAVPGEGNPQADILFIGEGPGFHEDKQGRPFVGASGNFLTQMLEGIGLKREDVFIANVVKCRPPQNRDPQPEEPGLRPGARGGEGVLRRPREPGAQAPAGRRAGGRNGQSNRSSGIANRAK